MASKKKKKQEIQKIINKSVFFGYWLPFVICNVQSVSAHSNLENQVLTWVKTQSFCSKVMNNLVFLNSFFLNTVLNTEFPVYSVTIKYSVPPSAFRTSWT